MRQRRVRIVTARGTHFVEFLERKKGSNYSAAQFDARDHSVEKVQSWIERNPDLIFEVGTAPAISEP
jgi:hypothetical protein